jgi:hypothetical protein
VPFFAKKADGKAYFGVRGPDMEPPEWGMAPPPESARREWYATVGAELYHEKRAEWRAGKDAYGRDLIPVRIPRIKDPSDWHGTPYVRGKGPPLLPFPRDDLSRGYNLLRVHADAGRAMVYWLPMRGPLNPLGPKAPTWPEILIFQARHPRYPRDVIGVSPEGLAAAIRRALARYRAGLGPRPVDYADLSRVFPDGVRPARVPRRPVFRPAVTTRFVSAGNVAAFVESKAAPARAPRRAAPPSAVPVPWIPSTRPAPLPRAWPEPWAVPLIFLLDRRPAVYRWGDRWLVAESPWGWEVLPDGSTDLALLAVHEGEPWERLNPEGDDVPERVYRVYRAVAAGAVEAA